MPDNLVLGKGKVYLRSRDPNALDLAFVSGERFVGNAPELNLTSETESLDHFTSTGGIRQKDKTVTLEVTRNGVLTTDNVDKDNLAMFFLGSNSVYSQTGGSISDEIITIDTQDAYYQLGETSTDPRGNRNVSVVVVGDDATPTTTYVDGTDYTVDLVSGRLYIIDGGAIANGGPQDIYLDYTAAVETSEQIISGSQEFVGAIRYLADNPEGADHDVYMPYVKLTPNGDYSLISDEWSQLSFNIEVLKLNSTTPSVYIDGRAA